MLNFGDDRPTFELAGHDWPLTELVKAYLEWVAIEVNYLYEEQTYEALYWDDGRLYYESADADSTDSEVLSPASAIDSVFGEVSEEEYWGWIIGCNLTRFPSKGVEPDGETISATRHRITEVVVWRLTAGRDVPEELQDLAREVLGQYSDADWEESLSEDPDLRIAKEELDL